MLNLLLILFFSLLIILLLNKIDHIKIVLMFSVLFSIIYIIYIYYIYNYNIFYYNGLYYNYNIIKLGLFNFIICYDSLSLILIFLTLILYFVSISVVWTISFNFKLLVLLIISVILFVTLSFISFDLFFFFIFFESILIPMLLIIGIWGSRERKLTAALRFFLFTLLGSILFLIIIIYFFYFIGTTNLFILLSLLDINIKIQKLFWFFLFIAFAVKVPMFPLHTWLPEAHAEAPTVGSILLAGILLKLGPYGLLRFSNILFPIGFYYYRSIIFFFCLLGVYYTSITAIRQVDMKKIVAYSSIGHMALIIIAILINTIESLLGAIILLIAHGFVSGGLFLVVGLLYDRYKTRIIYYFGGISKLNPKIAVCMFLSLLGNIAFPGTLNFVSELLIVISLGDLNLYLLILILISTLFVLSYNLFMFSRVFYGYENKLNENYTNDLTIRELMLNIIFIFPVYFFGFFSNYFIYILKYFIIYYIYNIYIY